MAKIITDRDVRELIKPPLTEYMVLRDKLQQIELMNDQMKNLQTVYEMYSRGYFRYRNVLQEIKEIAEDAYKNDEQYQSTGIYNEIIEKVNGILGKE